MTLIAKPRGGAPPSLFLLLLAVAGLRYASQLFSSTPLVDEQIYLRAARAVGAGISPYSIDGYFYPPAFATLTARAAALSSESWVLAISRGLNLFSVVWLVWRCAALARLRRRTVIITSCLLISFAPGISLGLESGNISPAICAAIVWSVLHWRRRPALGSCAIGSTLAWKPLALAALPVLLLHRSRRPQARAGPFAAAAGGACLATIPGIRFIGDFLQAGAALPVECFPLNRTASLHRLVYNLGFDANRLAVLVVAAAVYVVVSRCRRWAAHEVAALALAAATTCSPALWSHTLLLTLPLQALAIRELFRYPTAHPLRPSALASLAVLVCLLPLHFSEGVGGLDAGPSIAVAGALLPVLASPNILLAWLIARRGRRRGNWPGLGQGAR